MWTKLIIEMKIPDVVTLHEYAVRPRTFTNTDGERWVEYVDHTGEKECSIIVDTGSKSTIFIRGTIDYDDIVFEEEVPFADAYDQIERCASIIREKLKEE